MWMWPLCGITDVKNVYGKLLSFWFFLRFMFRSGEHHFPVCLPTTYCSEGNTVNFLHASPVSMLGFLLRWAKWGKEPPRNHVEKTQLQDKIRTPSQRVTLALHKNSTCKFYIIKLQKRLQFYASLSIEMGQWASTRPCLGVVWLQRVLLFGRTAKTLSRHTWRKYCPVTVFRTYFRKQSISTGLMK